MPDAIHQLTIFKYTTKSKFITELSNHQCSSPSTKTKIHLLQMSYLLLSKDILPVPFPFSIPLFCQKCPFPSLRIKCQHINRTIPDLPSYLLAGVLSQTCFCVYGRREVAGNLIRSLWQTLYCLLATPTPVRLEKTSYPVRIISHNLIYLWEQNFTDFCIVNELVNKLIGNTWMPYIQFGKL